MNLLKKKMKKKEEKIQKALSRREHHKRLWIIWSGKLAKLLGKECPHHRFGSFCLDCGRPHNGKSKPSMQDPTDFIDDSML